jgi:hypothetical protein
MRLQLLQTGGIWIRFSVGRDFGVHSSLEAVRFRLPPPELSVFSAPGLARTGAARVGDAGQVQGQSDFGWSDLVFNSTNRLQI